jgi:hypothetical protein
VALVEAFVQSSPQVVYSGKRCQLNDLTCRSLADVPWDGLFRGDAPGCPRFYLFLGSSFGQATRPIALGKLSWSRQSLGSLSTRLPSRLRCRLVRPDRRGSLQVVYLPSPYFAVRLGFLRQIALRSTFSLVHGLLHRRSKGLEYLRVVREDATVT